MGIKGVHTINIDAKDLLVGDLIHYEGICAVTSINMNDDGTADISCEKVTTKNYAFTIRDRVFKLKGYSRFWLATDSFKEYVCELHSKVMHHINIRDSNLKRRIEEESSNQLSMNFGESNAT